MTVLLAVAATSARALYIQEDIRDVPVARLVGNLERRAETIPRDADVRINLARLHGMAYALKSNTAQVRRRENQEEIWYGFEPRPIPYEPKPAATPEQQATAERHLRESIRWYEAALALEPKNRTAQLGLAWSFDQQGLKSRAIAGYRAVIEQAWDKERRLSSAELGQHFYTAEAAHYLIPLLDPLADREEIAELRRRIARLEGLPRPVTPLAVPLEDSLSPRELASPEAAVAFDADGSGQRRRWTWISSRGVWLVHDGGGDGRISSALQFFGSVSYWLFWRDGFDALGALDDDDDGVIRGEELEGLALWQDRNGNGVSERGEVRSLASHGIVALSYRASEPGDGLWVGGVARGAVRFADGRRRDLVDLILHRADNSATARRHPAARSPNRQPAAHCTTQLRVKMPRCDGSLQSPPPQSSSRRLRSQALDVRSLVIRERPISPNSTPISSGAIGTRLCRIRWPPSRRGTVKISDMRFRGLRELLKPSNSCSPRWLTSS